MDKYVLSNFSELTNIIKTPIQTSSRIKYTCFDAAQHYIVFGATSGSLYIFRRDPCTFLQIIPTKFGQLKQLSLSPTEKYLAFTNAKGTVGITDLATQSSSPQILTTQLEDTHVTCFYWRTNERELYLGDGKGNVSLVNLSFFMGRNLLNLTVHSILLLDSPIVQIDGHEDLLLVSTFTKCVLCNTEREEFKQIGNRPRDGEYGACVITVEGEAKIYCSRPGCRLWEVDLDGSVSNTHQYKVLLNAISSQNILYDEDDQNEKTAEFCLNSTANSSEPIKDNNLQFLKLFKLFDNLILVFNKNNFYIIDPRKSLILLWNNQFRNIQGIRAFSNSLVIYTSDCKVYSLKLQMLDSYLYALYKMEKYHKCCKLIANNLTYFYDKLSAHSVNLNYLLQMRKILAKTNDSFIIMNDIEIIFDKIQQNNFNGANDENDAGNENNHHKLLRQQNGIYILDSKNAGSHVGDDNAKINNAANSTDKKIKDALVSVVRGSYGKNIRQMIMGMNLVGTSGGVEDKETMDDASQNTTMHASEIPCDSRDIIPVETVEPVIMPASNSDIIAVVVDTITHYDNFITKSNKYNLDNILPIISDDDKNVRNMFLIYKSSKISKLSFLDRYADIFDRYDFNMIINLLKKLEQLMVDDDNQTHQLARENCIHIFFDYLKAEMIYEISDYSRDYIRDCFTTINGERARDDAVEPRCYHCDYPIGIADDCLYPEIGKKLLQYYWSRGEYEVCFEITKHATHLLEIICKFYIQERNATKFSQYLFNLANRELFEVTASLYELEQWRETFDLVLAFTNNQSMICLNCNEFCSLSALNAERQHSSYHSWDYILNVALRYVEPALLLQTLHEYADHIKNGAIGRHFFRQCLMRA